MKLRFPFRPQQLLSAAASAWILSLAASAQEVVVTADGQQRQVKVIGVSSSGQNLEFLVGAGKLGLPLASIKEVRMAAPAELAQAFAAYTARDFAKALTLTKSVVDRFRGMPAPWAQQATAALGDLYIQTGDLAKAEAAYNDFKRLYPGSGSLQSEVGMSRLAVAKKEFAAAKQKIEPIVQAALQEKLISAANALAYSQAFLVSGQVKEAEGDLPGALQDYLRTVTLFYHDRAAVTLAQNSADALRAAHREVTVP